MVLTNRKGIFSLTDIIQRQNTGDWPIGSWLDGSGKYHSLTNHYGYFGGGRILGSPAPVYSTVDRIDYNNDNVDTSPRGSLNSVRHSMVAVSNISYGYFGGGISPARTPSYTSEIHRIDYSNDSENLIFKSYQEKWIQQAGVGNNDYGYFIGGYNGTIPVNSIRRLDYANDTGGVTPKGPTTQHISQAAATGNQNYGYMAGGENPSSVTAVMERIDYSNDTGTSNGVSTLGTARKNLAATGNSNYGYFGGGETPSGSLSTIERIDYSNGTGGFVAITGIIDGSPSGISKLAATGNVDYGYWSGGVDNANPDVVHSLVSRLDFTNDTANTVTKGPLTSTRYALSAVSSTSNALPKQYDSVPHLAGESYGTQPIGTDYGYWGGGQHLNSNPPSGVVVSTIDRIDFSNDTNSTNTSTLSSFRRKLAATTNTDYGYFGGGIESSVVTKVDRLDYSNDTAMALSRGFLITARQNLSAVGNENYGYWGGGDNPSPTYFSLVERTDYSSDTAWAINKSPGGGALSQTLSSSAAVCNQNYGYFGGGGNPAAISSIHRLDYSNDSANLLIRADLSSERKSMSGTGNANFGYFVAGYPAPNGRKVDRLDYSTDTIDAIDKGNLIPTNDRFRMMSTGNANYGYFAGGDFPGAGFLSDIYRLDYSNDTDDMVSKGSLPVTSGETGGAGVCPRANGLPTLRTADRESLEGVLRSVGNDFGYWNLQDSSSQINRMDYSNDTAIASFRSSMGSGNRRSSDGVSSHNHGYWGGGDINPAPTPESFITTVERLDYANDTDVAVIAGPLTLGRRATAAAGNENYGYWATGAKSGPHETSTVDRIDYSNDMAGTLSRSTISSPGVSGMAGVGNKDYGYFGGGDNPGAWNPDRTKKVWRIDYSNDTIAASDRGDLNYFYVAHQKATGNANYGYFGGGWDGTSYRLEIQRLDYSNDEQDLVLKGTLATAMGVGSATGNQNFGYWGGGYAPARSPAETSEVQRLDYTNDTANVSPKGPLTHANQSWAATSSRANGLPTTKLVIEAFTFEKIPVSSLPYGYWGGGLTATPPQARITNTQRIDYSNDTSSLMLRGNLILGLNNLAAIGTQDYGYFGGGSDGSPRADLQRLDYSNDYSIMSQRASLSGSRDQNAAAGNKDYGYFGAGHVGGSPAATATIDRLDYANDTVRAPALGPLLTARYQLAATSTNDFGYWAGGNESPGYVSSIERTDFSNDIATAVTKGPLSKTRAFLTSCGTGTKDYGYIIGGSGPADSSSVDRIDYTNDTTITSTRGPLTSTRYYHSVTGSQSFGYVAGGRMGLPISPPSDVSNIDRIDYSNDTAAIGVRNYLVAGSDNKIREMASVSAQQHQFVSPYNLSAGTSTSSVYGYFGGGNAAGGTYITTVDRLDFTNDTANTVTKGPLTLARYGLSGTGNSNGGYFIGGYKVNDTVSTVDRIDYSNDVAIASIRSPLVVDRYLGSAVGNANFGYYASGTTNSPDTDYSTIYRIDYTNDTAATTEISAKQPGSASARHAAVGNQSYGFIGGGWDKANTVTIGKVNRIDYSSETLTLVGNNTITGIRWGLAATGNKDYGYFGGGYDDTANVTLSSVERLDYSTTLAIAAVKGPLSVLRHYLFATGNKDYGYFGGGNPGPQSIIDRIDYSNDTVTATPKGVLTQTKELVGAVSAQENALSVVGLTLAEIDFETRPGSSAYGYFGGGSTSSTTHSNVDRLDFTNDTANAVTKGSLNANKEGLGSIGNLNYGYFGGGNPGPKSDIDRIDYSNNSVSTIGATLTAARWVLSAVGNKDYGYFAGGRVPGSPDVFHSTVDRIDYSNDTVRSPFQGPLNDLQTGQNASAGNSSYGYVAGGYDGSSPPEALVNRIDYSNDTLTAISKGPLSTARDRLAATGNENYGYFGAGYGTASAFSIIDRIDYANDLAVATPKGTLTDGKYGLSATGNKDYGYFGGGQNSSDAYTNTIDRTDYSNDTTVLTQRSLSTSVKNLSGSSAGANGLPQ